MVRLIPVSSGIERLRPMLVEAGVDAFVTLHRPNRRYLTGFSGSAGCVIVTADAVVLITDGRYTHQARQEAPDVEVVEQELQLWPTLAEQLQRLQAEQVGFEPQHVTVTWLEQAQQQVPVVNWLATDQLVERLRLVKSEAEIETIRRAQLVTDRVFTEILPLLRPGVSERQIAIELESRLIDHGAEGGSFPFIVASGERSALPHGTASGKLLATGDLVTLDFGCIVDGYCSDMTRTVVIGRPDVRQQQVYDAVLRAQEAGLAAIRPGLRGQEVDAAARSVIEAVGFGEQFGHGLGHGVGLEVHEAPRLSKVGNDELQPGMVVTVEPGIYLPGWGGVRIEDLVVVREDGYENLTQSSKELLSLT